jgi:hypothetical protein
MKLQRQISQHAPASTMAGYSQPRTMATGARWLPVALFYTVVCWLGMISPETLAKPGTHGRAISTWDTTRSTLSASYHRGFILEGGSANQVAYNATFTSTTGKLSAQFSVQYMNLSPDELPWTLHGGGVSAAVLYGIPMGERYSNGLPRAALSIFGGIVPAIQTNGTHSFTTFPVVFGLGFEFSPIRLISITPWVEGAVSFNLDTVFRYNAFQDRISEGSIEDVQIEYGPDGQIVNVSVQNGVVDDVIDEVIQYDTALSFRIRGGLTIAVNLGDRMDFQVNGTVAQMGNDFDAPPTICIGGAFVFAWDDAPLLILPEEKRAATLSCGAAGARYRDCGQYRALLEQTRKEERKKVQDECEKTIVVSHSDTPGQGDKTDAPLTRPPSPVGVGVSASELKAASTDSETADTAGSAVPAEVLPPDDATTPAPPEDASSTPVSPGEDTQEPTPDATAPEKTSSAASPEVPKAPTAAPSGESPAAAPAE